MSLRAVLYDFDGTLADTTELIMRCYRHTMSTHLGSVPPEEEWLSGFGTPLELQIGRFARTGEECEAMLDTYRAYQEAHYETLLRPFPGAVEVVAELERRGVALAIVTSRHQRSTLRGIELCGLTRHFEVIVTPEDVTHAKPHPEPVLRAAGGGGAGLSVHGAGRRAGSGEMANAPAPGTGGGGDCLSARDRSRISSSAGGPLPLIGGTLMAACGGRVRPEGAYGPGEEQTHADRADPHDDADEAHEQPSGRRRVEQPERTEENSQQNCERHILWPPGLLRNRW
jgi:beta-phosphoglucomutase-like phosphatase (HAD superfamily)